MTEQQFKKIAALFSFVLLLDVLLLPSAISLFEAAKDGSGYSLLLESFLIYFCIFIILAAFWMVGLCEIYAVFFLGDREAKVFVIKIFANLIKKVGYRNNQLSKVLLFIQTISIMGGMLLILLYEGKIIFELLLN